MTTTTDAKSIRYDRSTRDYRAEYEGQLVGFYGSYHAAEVALDAYVYELLQDTAVETADMEADAADELISNVAIVAEQLAGERPVEAREELYQELELLIASVTNGRRGVRSAPSSQTGMRVYTLIDHTKYCSICGSLLGINRQECGIRICPDCERVNQADVDAQFCITPIAAPDLLAEVDTLLASASLDDLWRTSGIEWDRRSARIRANVMARIAAPTCRNCGAGHTIQTCPEIRALLFAPVVERVLERVA